MARLNLTPDEFANIVTIFLYDKVLHPDKIATKNEEFNEFIDKIGSVIRPLLTKNYVNLPSDQRYNYKRIKDVFHGKSSGIETIRIIPSVEKVKKIEKEKGTIKKLIGKLLNQETLKPDEMDLIYEYVKD